MSGCKPMYVPLVDASRQHHYDVGDAVLRTAYSAPWDSELSQVEIRTQTFDRLKLEAAANVRPVGQRIVDAGLAGDRLFKELYERLLQGFAEMDNETRRRIQTIGTFNSEFRLDYSSRSIESHLKRLDDISMRYLSKWQKQWVDSIYKTVEEHAPEILKDVEKYRAIARKLDRSRPLKMRWLGMSLGMIDMSAYDTWRTNL